MNSIEDGMEVYIASAFFTEFDVIDELIQRNCRIRIVVRLGFPTSPIALKHLLNNSKNIEARFYTNPSFHPKLYILGDKIIFVGSANLTKSALLTNQEIMIGLLSDDSRYEELIMLFSEYWDAAKVLTYEEVEKYEKIYKTFKSTLDSVNDFDYEVEQVLGDVNFPNIERYVPRQKKSELFLDSFLKSYQESVSAFNLIEQVYKRKSRKIDLNLIPLRLEIDSFFSFVRDRHAINDIWKEQKIGWDTNKEALLNRLIDEWMNTNWPHFEDTIVHYNYPLINKILGSKAAIELAKPEQIVDALCVAHSFYDRLRFYKGGLNTLKQEFLRNNDISRIKKTLIYLLHDESVSLPKRIADCIFDPKYKLNEFGQSNIQELVGWVNSEGKPVINGRTTKVLRYFGFNVRQIS